MFYVYVLHSKSNGHHYVGYTSDLTPGAPFLSAAAEKGGAFVWSAASCDLLVLFCKATFEA
jgi:predicted GIY-YIG superfamily endonuclease